MAEIPMPPVADEIIEQDAIKPEVQSINGGWGKQLLLTLIGWTPSTLVVGGLIGLAWFGHHYDWKMPKVGALSASVDSEQDWCESHGVPEANCIICVAGLIEDAPKLEFCQLHGVHGCVLHDPSLAQTSRPVEATLSDLEHAERAIAIRPRRENLAVSQLPGTRIQFASIDAMTKAGVDVEPVERRAITEGIQMAGEVRYDATKMAHISPTVDGIVRQVNVKIGDWVDSGKVLSVVDSQKVGELKSNLLSALLEERLKQDSVDRFAKLAPSGAVSGRRLIEGKTELKLATVAVEQAVRAFVNLGLQVDLRNLRSTDLETAKKTIRIIGMEQIKSASDSDNLIAVVASLEGRVVGHESVVGEIVDRSAILFK